MSSIFFCFKTKIDNEEYKQKFKDNKDIIEKNNVIDNSVVKNYIINTLSKVQDMAEEKKKMEENSKRF